MNDKMRDETGKDRRPEVTRREDEQQLVDELFAELIAQPDVCDTFDVVVAELGSTSPMDGPVRRLPQQRSADDVSPEAFRSWLRKQLAED